MKINYKKTAKLLTLLVTSLLIATASAQVYQAFMYLEGTITVGFQKIVWIKEGQEIIGDTVSIGLSVEPNVTVTINGTLYLKNKDNSNHTINSIKVVDAVGSNYETCKVYVYENFTGSGTWNLVGTLDLKSLSSEITDKLLWAGGYYKFDFEIKATSSVGDNDFKIKVTYE